MKICIFSEVTLNGKMTLQKNSSSKYLLSNFSDKENKYIHSLRGEADAIVIGRKTVSIDNPYLTNRLNSGKSPDRIVISNSLNFTFKENIFSSEAHTIIVTSQKNKNHINVETITNMGHECVFLGEKEVCMYSLIDYFRETKKYNTIIIEGGGTTITKFLTTGLVDTIYVLRLPIIAVGMQIPEFAEFLNEQYCINLKYINSIVFENFIVEKYELQK